MKIFVRKFDGELLTFDVKSGNTTTVLKERINDNKGIPAEDILIFEGKQLTKIIPLWCNTE